MNALLTSLAGESVLLLGLVSAVLAALGVSDAWQKVAAAAVPLVLALLVRQVVVKPATVAAVAEQAAVRTAEQLTDATVGKAGEVTGAAGNVVTGVVNEVIGGVGGLVPKLAARTGGE